MNEALNDQIKIFNSKNRKKFARILECQQKEQTMTKDHDNHDDNNSDVEVIEKIHDNITTNTIIRICEKFTIEINKQTKESQQKVEEKIIIIKIMPAKRKTKKTIMNNTDNNSTTDKKMRKKTSQSWWRKFINRKII